MITLTQDEPHALRIVRDIIATTNAAPLATTLPAGGWAEPLYPAEELRACAPDLSRGGKPVDPRAIIARLLDGSEFEEFKANYGTTLVTGTHTHTHKCTHP